MQPPGHTRFARVFAFFVALAGLTKICGGAEATAPIESARELWAGYDPRAQPLEITVAKSWDEGAIHLEQLNFTGETWEGSKVRVFAYRGAPLTGSEKLPGILHLHGGGQTASLAWVRYWAARGYICVSHDFCGLGPGRAADLVTQWGAAPAYMADPNGPRSSLHPNARFNSWYHWTLVARRALTLLEEHPRINPQRLGVFGISVGGTLTWMVAGCDSRVAAAVPIYGVGQNSYTFPWQSPDDAVDEDTKLTRALIEPEGYASDVKCPVLFMNASNDHHGRLDLGMRTLALVTRSPMLREIYTPRSIHHIEPAEATDLRLWMDFHLKVTGPDWAKSPTIEFRGGDSVPQIVVTVDRRAEVESVTAYYGLNNPWPTSRFYRTSPATESEGATFVCAAPVLTEDDTLYGFANVVYRSGIRLSTRLLKASAPALPGVRATISRTELIDPMDDDQKWFWWLAGTDPLDQLALLQTWKGPHGERGFTHAQPGAFSFATMALGDPQFHSVGSSALLLDVLAEALPASLEISVATKFFQPGQEKYKMRPQFGAAKEGWVTLRLEPGEFRETKVAPLGSWKDVDFLCLSGTSEGGKRTVFKNLRWEKLD